MTQGSWARSLAALGVLTGALLGGAGAGAGDAGDSSGRVVIVVAPRLEWADVAIGDAPTIAEFAGEGASALQSVRAIGPFTGLAEGLVSLGAGNRAAFRTSLVAPVIVAPDGRGHSWSVRPARLDADRKLYGAEPGALGSALHAAGRTTALAAATDSPARDAAALAIADEAGRIDAVVDSIGEAPTADVTVVVLDQLERIEPLEHAGRYRLPRGHGPAVRARAVSELDDEFARVVASTSAADLVMLVAPAATDDAGRLTVFAMGGEGVHPGAALSATTRRAHYVTLADIAPTVLDRLGITVPDAMNDTPISGGHGAGQDPAWLTERAERAVYRDRTIGPVSVVYIVAQVLTYGIAAGGVARGRPRLRRLAGAVALVILAFPTATFLSGFLAYRRLALAAYVLALVAASAVLAVVARRLVGSRVAAAVVLVTLGWAVQVVDIMTSGRLQIDTPFGYSPIVAGRFQGYGNLAFSIVAMSALVVMTARWPGIGPVVGPTRRRVLAVPLVVAGITLVADGLPRFGADVGGVLAFLPAAAVTVLVLTGRRVNVARLALVGAAAAGMLGIFAWVDHRRPAAERTHLARFTDKVLNGEAGQILHRKLDANLHILTSSIWTWLMPVALVFLAIVATRPRGAMARLQHAVPGVRAALAGAAVLAVLGFALNDSGIAIPAMMCGVLLPWIVVLVEDQPG